jgi:hypothetical protein
MQQASVTAAVALHPALIGASLDGNLGVGTSSPGDGKSAPHLRALAYPRTRRQHQPGVPPGLGKHRLDGLRGDGKVRRRALTEQVAKKVTRDVAAAVAAWSKRRVWGHA